MGAVTVSVYIRVQVCARVTAPACYCILVARSVTTVDGWLTIFRTYSARVTVTTAALLFTD